MPEAKQAAFKKRLQKIVRTSDWGRLGRWDFAICRDPQNLPHLLAQMS